MAKFQDIFKKDDVELLIETLKLRARYVLELLCNKVQAARE